MPSGYYCQFDPSRERARIHHRSSETRTTAETLEYWFSDANLGYDEFMREKIREGQGWVDLDVLLTFKTLINRNVDKQTLISIIRRSQNLELNSDKTKVCRKDLVDWFVSDKLDYFKIEHKRRTVVIIGFKEHLDAYYMNKYFGPHRFAIEHYAKRMHEEPMLVFVQFFNKKDADEFLRDRNMKIWRKCNLLLMTQFEYDEMMKDSDMESNSSANISQISNTELGSEYFTESKMISSQTCENHVPRFSDYLEFFTASKVSSVV
uniref:HTH La-type RNA-binding domain-containing protein n=1 Tax=Panagrolaimus sp. JU765 TaxID=591449 RepID=A0AC34RTP1_9BILA